MFIALHSLSVQSIQHADLQAPMLKFCCAWIFSNSLVFSKTTSVDKAQLQAPLCLQMHSLLTCQCLTWLISL